MSDPIDRQAAIALILSGKVGDDSLVECPEECNSFLEWAAEEVGKMPSAQTEYRLDEWCTDCKEYDQEKNCCPRFNKVIKTTLEEMKEAVCGKESIMDDLISRQAAIDRIEEHIRVGDELYPLTETDRILNHAFEIAASCVYNLPSAERKKGKWIHERLLSTTGGSYPVVRCSVCSGTIPFEWETRFCPNCGAGMRGEEG